MSYTHLTEDERYHIDEMLRNNYSQVDIAKALNRSPSSISRELNRNKGKRGWRPRQADIKARERLSGRGSNNVKNVPAELFEYAENKLSKTQWSPEQIAGRAKLDKIGSISHETIYKYILKDKQAGGVLYTHLRCKKKRKKRYGSKAAGRGCIPNRIGIEDRPNIVDSKSRVGDWEGDTIIGSNDGGAVLATMVERKSRFTVIAKSKNKMAESVINCIISGMASLSDVAKTVTLDNGKEFSAHRKLTVALGVNVYFARPYHSWERGANENTNGLIRQYFPKKTRFDSIPENEIYNVANMLNNRPRKCLGYRTPAEVLLNLAKSKGIALRI